MPTKTVSIRVDKDLWSDAKIYCIKNNLTLGELVESLLEKVVKKE